MAELDDRVLVVAVPERLDRRLRLGPFPSTRDALKFVVYAAVGALLAPFASPFLWLPIVALGFAVAVWRPEGVALDERAVAVLRWWTRTGRRPMPMSRGSPPSVVLRGMVREPDGSHRAIVAARGVPISYLPPDELARRFVAYRDLLKGFEGSFALRATPVPVNVSAVSPRPETGGTSPEDPRAGYTGLVIAICRRRALRRIEIVLRSDRPGPDGIARLERQVEQFVTGLAAAGVPSAPLEGRALADAARRRGWPRAEAPR
jgi:hypothetical protein